ncbi:MAG TPA: hypothetical protein VFK06_00885 [Candidatus Angelobacter sp.]|nr:hypothetical protein [Candidatus Angelobacter sp.]
MARSKLPVLLLLYPGFAWLLSWLNGALADGRRPPELGMLAEYVRSGVYAVVGLSFLFLLAVPLWSARYRKQAQHLPAAFRRGLYVASALLWIILPVQGVLLALALYVAGPDGLWFWGIFVAGGSFAAILMLRQSELSATPDIYMTLRASRLQVEDHPKLEAVMRELSEAFRVPLPRHILVGLQPELIPTIGTVFCPDGELEGGTLCFSLTTASMLSINEFRFLTGEALLNLHAGLRQKRKDFLSTFESARDVLTNLDESMREWSWFPKWGFHPFLIVIRLVAVAAMRFPLYVGKEWITFYVREVCSVRQAADIDHAVSAHSASTDEVGPARAISALIKEAAISLGLRFNLSQIDRPWYGLNEVYERAAQEHPDLEFDGRAPSHWPDPANAWQHLQFRCSLSGVSLEWCRLQALNVRPHEPAISLFEEPARLVASLIETRGARRASRG